MVPALPSTVTSCPGCRRAVASPVATTAGIPYRGPPGRRAQQLPLSVTTAAARANRGVHAGAVAFATSTSPSRNPPKSCGPCTMRTGPVARPADTGCPRMTFSPIFRSPRAARRGRSHLRSAEPAGKCQWRGEVALALPQVAALPHEVNNRLTLLSPKCDGHFVAGAEEHIIGLFDRTGRDHVFASRRTQARRTGHPRVKSRACSSRMTAYR